MIFNKLYLELIQEQRSLGTPKTKPLVDAIKSRHPITFYYNGPQSPEKERVLRGYRVKGEPVAIGLSKKGNLVIRGWVEPPSVSKKGFNKTRWRTYMVSRMTQIEITNEIFNNKRPDYKEGDDKSMSVTYVTSDWTKTPTVKTDIKPQPATTPIPKKELPQPKAQEKPSVSPAETIKKYDTQVYNKLKTKVKTIGTDKVIDKLDFDNAVKELYRLKEQDWIDSQKRIGGNIKAGEGTRRRFEYRGIANNIRVYDDYAHHPTEITATLKAARDVVAGGKIVVAFQAHHYYRTALFNKEFGQALALADEVVVLEVFAPGEEAIPGASGQTMASLVPLPKNQVIFEPSWSKVAQHLVDRAKPNDIIMTLGAGDIGLLAPEVLNLLESKSKS